MNIIKELRRMEKGGAIKLEQIWPKKEKKVLWFKYAKSPYKFIIKSRGK